MIAAPAELLGLPWAVPDPGSWQVVALRWGLLALGLAWAAGCLRAPAWAALSAGLLLTALATGFFALALGRPYGVLEDPLATRRAALVSVSAERGEPSSFLARHDARPAWPWAALLEHGVPPRVVNAAPSLLPVVAVPLLGLLFFGLWPRRAGALWPRRDEALLAACLALAFSSGDAETLRGAGLVSGAWTRPETTIAVVLAAGLILAAARLPLGPRGSLAAGLAAAAAWLCVPTASAGPAPLDALLLLSLDQLPWSLLAALGFAGAASGARALALAGAGFVLAAAVGLPVEPWGAASLFRLGAVACAVSPLAQLVARLATAAGAPAWWRGAAPPRAAAAATLALLLPGSLLAWWEPMRSDPVAKASREPVSATVTALAGEIRRATPRDAVFLASAQYAPFVAVLAGRRVLRAPSLLLTSDDGRRVRAEGALLAGRVAPAAIGDFGVSHVLIAPGDFGERGILRPADLEGRPRLRLLLADARGFRVYEVLR